MWSVPLWSYRAGDKIDATILRNGKVTTVALTLTRGEAITHVSTADVDVVKK